MNKPYTLPEAIKHLETWKKNPGFYIIGAPVAVPILAELERLKTVEGEWMSLSQDDGKLEREIERLQKELAELRERCLKLQHE